MAIFPFALPTVALTLLLIVAARLLAFCSAGLKVYSQLLRGYLSSTSLVDAPFVTRGVAHGRGTVHHGMVFIQDY